ncbi:MAG TPA: HDOD domain-containing protein [Pyrinomonadaceae bacterium]|nr:HDOD domain-containing protein [Pyrinomonadaceae bacterium]
MFKSVDLEFFSIENLVKTGLPSMPSSVMRISALMADLNVSQQRIAGAISLDPVISSRILALANSPIYALHGTITNLTEAVNVVGNGAIAEQLLVCGVSDAFGRKVLDSPAGRTIWVHSLATGLTANEICKMAKMRGAEDAFSCGLLHDVGKLILLRADAPFYTDLIKQGEDSGDISVIERRVLGFDHAELGAAAGIAWKLPGAVCHMIRNHHHPSTSTAGVALAHVLQTADQFVKGRISFEDPEYFFANDELRKFGLGEVEFEDIWDNVTLRLSEMTDPGH